MSIRRVVTNGLVGLVLVGLYVASYSGLQHHRRSLPDAGESSSGIWNLSPVIIAAIAGEFKGLMADYLTLEAGARLGAKVVRTPDGKYREVKRRIDWPTIHRLYMASQYLDPSFEQTYTVAQGWLPWEGGMVREMQAILRTAAQARPWDWKPTHLQGFNTYYFLRQPGEAGKLFLEAARVPNAPSFLPILGARLAQKGGETAAAIVLMRSMLADKTPDDPDYDDLSDRLQALQGVQQIEEASRKFQAVFARMAQSIDELLTSGMLATVPANPYKVAYCMDRAGIVYFDQPDCRQ